jgi:hypothetical protein
MDFQLIASLCNWDVVLSANRYLLLYARDKFVEDCQVSHQAKPAAFCGLSVQIQSAGSIEPRTNSRLNQSLVCVAQKSCLI